MRAAGSRALGAGLTVLLLGMPACRSGEPRAPAIGEAYAGPATLGLRKDIPLQSPVVATVTHGDRLEIVQRRRRFLKVRAPGGAEGWIEDHLLLSSAEIAALKEVERRALALPSQGVASTYEMLNVHTEPNRLSPSFLQVKEGEKVDLVAHVSAPRTPPERKPLIPPRPKTPPSARKREEQKYPLPPMPAAPPPPPNWKDLSQTPPEVQQAIADSRAANAAPKEDWSLVRNVKGESGWVLSRRLYMAIPDEVAQYAEGHRITSYFALSDVRDDEAVKHNWLWTTIGSGDHPYDFDSFRVFTWSLRRHRYETAYIQRNVEGYFPVLARPAGFSVCVVNKSGARMRRNYSFIVTTVRFTGEQPCEAPGGLLQGAEMAGSGTHPHPPTPAAQNPSLYARLKTLAKKWFRR
ncbi:MAG TPA: SH3 domain-containing protein [Bryobacteraceae bacterium]|nr:SH3 domain-containing protein [Bryobacteraceae bacterium]